MSDVVTDFLAHHGVLGMHWGKHLPGRGGVSTPRQARTPSQDHIQAHALKSKKLHELSNDEVRTLVNRLNLERQFNQLNPSAQTKAKQATLGILSRVGNQAVNTVINKSVKLSVDKAFELAGLDSGKKKKKDK